MSAEVRPLKRIRQRHACEPCRRKKTRCPGEKPSCSYCWRLGQVCSYKDDLPHNGNKGPLRTLSPTNGVGFSREFEDRQQNLEAKLAAALESFNPRTAHNNRSPSPAARRAVQNGKFTRPATKANGNAASALPPCEVIVLVTEYYLLYCDCQPLPLFSRDQLVSTLKDRDPEVLYAILALTLRFFDNPLSGNSIKQLTGDYTEASRKIVMRRVTEGPVELSTLQALCLLSLVDFSNGNKHRATIHSSLAMNLAHCSGLTSESPVELDDLMREERRRCFWSIFLLKRLHGADVSALDFSGEEDFPWYPKSSDLSGREEHSASGPPIYLTDGSTSRGVTKDLGVVAYAIQLSGVWFKTTRYARRRGSPDKLPPWSPQSEYATIVAQQMEFETRVPYIHRFKPSGFAKKSAEELHMDRSYWCPWLFIQFVYHTSLCLLNHPLILALRLRDFRNQIPEIFIQHTSDLTTTHASWIVHLIGLLKLKSFKVSDPFLGYCAAIVATILLQQSFISDGVVREEKHADFDKCFEFVQSFGPQWPHIARLADKLQRLQETVSATYDISPNPQLPSRGLLIDLSRFWEILEYSSASEINEFPAQYFGSSIYLGPSHPAAEVSNTTSLPAPTRVQPDEIAPPQENTTLTSEVVESAAQPEAIVPDSVLQNEVDMADFEFNLDLPYTDEEMAALTDGFFNQRPDLINGSIGDWWGPGNL